MNRLNPLSALKLKMNNIRPLLEYNEVKNHKQWYDLAYKKLIDLLGYERFKSSEMNFRIEKEHAHNAYDEIRFTIETEENCDMPCVLLVPKHIINPPLMICLQGHSTGMHISLGETKFAQDTESIKGGRDFGIQAVSRGMAALCLEQRGFGTRKENTNFGEPECHIPAMTELLIGRTMNGARVWDISRAIDAVQKNFYNIDMNRIYIMGTSGGGISAFYASCIDTRIKACISSCAICSFSLAIAVMKHCVCNHIPHILDFFEMGDIAGLIAPRPLLVIAGRYDTTFPIEGVLDAYEKIEQIYKALDCAEQCNLVIGEGGHKFYPKEAWGGFDELMKKHI